MRYLAQIEDQAQRIAPEGRLCNVDLCNAELFADMLDRYDGNGLLVV